ncbi:MAG: hypothetical protein RL077_2436 [Verrucomicrobiota bacterium]
MLSLNRRVSRLPRRVLALTLILFFALPPIHLCGAEAVRRPFAIPAADAELTLETFSDQAGAQLVYLIENVRGVTTHPVQGTFAIRDALERLVARTELRVEVDGKTGAFVIKRDGPLPSSAEVPPVSSKPPTQPMKSPRTLLAVLAAFTSGALTAQTPPTTATKDDPVQLSPFFVTTATQPGYLANETLAGMRIKTDLKDVGAAINVLTETFLNEVGAVDMNQALKYLPNMQYADYADARGNAQWFSAPYMSRGVVGNSVMTDFFLTGSVPIDRYNTDNLTFLRGPNSILFGVGSPSGVVGASAKRASLGQNSQSARFVADTFGSARTELDVSHVFVKNKLAARFAGVASDQHNDQKPSLVRRNALYGSVTYKPFSRTTVTANGESGRYDRYFQIYNLVADAYTPWVLAGRPTVNFVTGKGMTNGSTTKGQFSTAIGSGMANLNTGSNLIYIEGSNQPIMDWRNMARGAFWSQTVAAGNPGTGLILSADRSSMDLASFTRENTIIDLRVNPWGGYNTNDLHYKNRSVFVEQNLWRDLDLELAWNQFNQGYNFNNTLGKGGPRIYVDPNEVLPNGAPNPNVGKPYIDTAIGSNDDNGIRRFRSMRELAAKRATLSYKLDLDRHKIIKHVGLGNYRFAGLFQDSEADEKIVVSNFVNVTPLPGTPANSPLNQNANRLNRRDYLNPGESQYMGYNYVQNFSQASVPGATIDGPLKFEERNATENPRNTQQSTESLVGAVQGSWWQAADGYFHVTGLFGLRQDRMRDRAQTFVRQANGEFAGPIDKFDRLDEFGTWNPLAKVTAHTKTYNVMFRPISQVRLFYNFSDVFRAAAANFFDLYGKPLRPSIGQTKDYGVKLDGWGGRVFLSATRYETGIIDTSSDNSGTVRGPINDIYNAMSRPDLVLDRPFSYRDDISKGYEFELTAAVTKNWRTRLTYGTQKTVPSGAFADWVVYFENTRSLWQQNSTRLLLNPGSGYTTVADAIVRADQFLRDARAVNGVQPADQRSRNATFNTNIDFTRGWLKSMRVGGGFQWASRNVIGYARDSVGNLDRSKPFRGAERFSTDGSIGYSCKLYQDKVTWNVQINVYNLLGEDPLLARTAVDDGKGNPLVTRRYLQTRTYAQLTNSFKF